MPANKVELVIIDGSVETTIYTYLKGHLPIRSETVFINNEGFYVQDIKWEITPEGKLGTIKYYLYPALDEFINGEKI